VTETEFLYRLTAVKRHLDDSDTLVVSQLFVSGLGKKTKINYQP
jgi:hypothetical protein